jgi:hypothetical protein
MGASELPKDLVRGRSRFQAWRRRRGHAGGRIPRSLWKLAVQLVASHGVSRTATVLGLHYQRLQKQVEAAAGQLPARGPAFVELPAAELLGKQCLFELANGAGATMRVQLTGYDAADVAILARGFWSGQ